MAKVDPNIERYFQIHKKLRSGRKVTNDELSFYYEYLPEIDQAKINEYTDALRQASKDPKNFVVDPDLTEAAFVEVARKLQSDPDIKAQTLEIAKEAEAGRVSDKVATGINLVLGSADIGVSLNQISQGKRAAQASRRPSRPAVPQRDLMLQQALRNSQENTYDAQRAIAPVQQNIQDQYLSDVQGAKTASTGQAGAYGAYRQLAANRRNRSAMELAPIQDSIRAREQQRTDQLLGMRADETQNMFQNQASLYPYDLRQYNYDQEAAASLGSTGRANLRQSLYGLGNTASGFIGQAAAQRKYDALINRAIAAGVPPEPVVKAEQNLRGYVKAPMTDTQAYYEQLYGPH